MTSRETRMSSGISFKNNDRAGDADERGVQIEVLGDSRPFSKYGQSICYFLSINGYRFLIDCGAPLFEHLTRQQIENIDGLFATHSHEDHKRWFTDLAIYLNYLTEGEDRLDLITIDPIHEEYRKNSRGALERTLSPDSRDVVEVPYRAFVNPISFGPKARYRIRREQKGDGSYGWRVVDEEGNPVPPDRAKIVIMHPREANRPRMLFRDPETSKWVEPERYYSFSSDVFYHQDEDRTIVLDEDSGADTVRISPVKDPVWHGPTTIGIDIQTPRERVVFSSDTVYDPDLWRKLAQEERELDLGQMTREEFESASILYGDINDYIEASWSDERLESAAGYYRDAVVVHDCGPHGDPVHTEYEDVRGLECEELLLTHCPDRFISEYPVAISGKKFTVSENELLEEVGTDLVPLDGDVYVRHSNRSYIGFQDPDGRFQVIRKADGTLEIAERPVDLEGDEVMNVKLYRDIGGRYYPYLREDHHSYRVRPDQRVERVQFDDTTSRGMLVEDLRAEDGGIRDLEQPADSMG